MSLEAVEHEIADLKLRMATIEAKVSPPSRQRWQEAVGMMKDCDLLDEALRLGAEWRKKANDEGR